MTTKIKAVVKQEPKRKRPTKSRYAIRAQRRKKISEELAKRATKSIGEILAKFNEIAKKGVQEFANLTEDQYETVYKGFALRVDPYEKKVRKALEEFHGKQRKEVIGNLPEITKALIADTKQPDATQKIAKASLFDFTESLKAFIKITSPIFTELAAKEGKAAGALLGIESMNILTSEVQNALEQSVKLLGSDYNKTTQDLLKDKLEAGLKEGLSQAELADQVNAIYDYSDEVRALTVARTETFRVANMATEQAWKQSGIVKSKVWFTAADERVCPYCGPLHGKVISIDSNFYDKGQTITGSDGGKLSLGYDDISAGALHPNCRCYIRPGEITLE